MILRTVEQVRRVFRIIAGFTLLLVGGVMLVTPGPGWLVIFLGLGLLAAEFVWAERLMKRIKREGGRVMDAVWPPGKNTLDKGAEESNKTAEERKEESAGAGRSGHFWRGWSSGSQVARDATSVHAYLVRARLDLRR